MMTEKMKVGLIGRCGHTGEAYRYLKTRQDVEIVGYAPASEHEEMAPYANDIPLYADYREMLSETAPQLAVVSPVFGLTAAVATVCAEMGVSIFAEKPIAPDLGELIRLRHAIEQSGVRFCAMHYLRYDPAFYHGARMVRDGAIGELRLLNAQKSYRFGTRPTWYRDRSLYVGTIPWVGIHAIDWIYRFSGKRFLSVNALSFGDSPEMSALCQFELEGGTAASATLDYYRPDAAPTHGDDRIRCVGTEGILEVCGGEIHLIDQNGERTIIPEPAPDLLGEFIDHGESIPTDEIFYLNAVALLTRDSADRRTTIQIPLEKLS